MARLNDRNIPQILEAAELWKERCLLADGSVFSSRALWTPDNLDALKVAFVDHGIEGDRQFIEKFCDQVRNESSQVQQLAAETLWVLRLFPSDIGGEKKRADIQRIWELSGETLPDHPKLLNEALEFGVGSAGMAYNLQPWRELGCLIQSMVAWKGLAHDQQVQLLEEPWRMAAWLDGREEMHHRQLYHILVYLLFPDSFERMATPKHKREVVAFYEHTLFSKPKIKPSRLQKERRPELDKRVLTVRQALEKRYPNRTLDFYLEPLVHDGWHPISGTTTDYPVWIEKTHIKGRADRESGPNALGKCLWSPQTSKSGAAIYEEMTQIELGHVVLHFTDNKGITGISNVAGEVDDQFVCPEGTEWSGRPGYRVVLEEYETLEPVLPREALLGAKQYSKQLKRIQKKYRKLFFNKKLELNQGAYLTRVPEELAEILNQAYVQVAGHGIPGLPPTAPTEKQAWIFQGNPKYYDVVGAVNHLETICWLAAAHREEIEKGDKAYIWVSGKDAGVVAEATVLEKAKNCAMPEEEAKFARDKSRFAELKPRVLLRIDRVLPKPLSRQVIMETQGLSNLSIIRAPQGTSYQVTSEQNEIMERLIDELGNGGKGPANPRYMVDDFMAETGFPYETVIAWKKRLDRKKHIVFQGPPGTGKTYVAERLARLLLSETNGLTDVVQFHPSYAYEDFMQGIRPELLDQQLAFELKPGRFLEFCKRATAAAPAPCVLIIDEINRANLSRVFGELMYLLEYRDKSVPLAAGGKPFQVPNNVYLIGTMNTADQSIALVDHALRRRFSFIFLEPQYEILKGHLAAHGLPGEGLVEALRKVNRTIGDRNYEVGISFFMADGENLKETLADIWIGEIEPYLEEFFFDQTGKVDDLRWEKLSKSVLSEWA